MLVIEVEYLGGVVHACEFLDRSRPEWPPHPDRLFSALVATAYQPRLGEGALDALRWLERQAPPEIACSDAKERTSNTVYVPINDPTSGHPLLRTRQGRWFPAVIPDDPMVQFVWPTAAPEPAIRQALAALAANVAYLGSSRTPVAARVVEQAREVTWVPGDSGELALRVVGEGRLEELDRLFAINRPVTAGRLQFYRANQPAFEIASGEFRELILLRRTGGVQLESRNVLTLTEALRQAVLSVAGDEASSFLHGHDHATHCGWAGLPFVNHPHADGRILGVAALLPRTTPPEGRLELLRALAQLEQIMLPGGQSFRVETAINERRRTLQHRTWQRPARCWTSITPILLDRFPKPPNPAGREQAIRMGCRMAGLPEPVSVEIYAHSPVKGVDPSMAFRVRRSGQPKRPYTHATLEFPEPVRGPLLVGAGRYFGLGLMLPLDSGNTEDGQ